MPWEIDLALLTYDRIAKSLQYINDDIILESRLNLSSYIINWNESRLPKEFFIDKYKDLEKILTGRLTHNSKVYDGDQLYGHLDLEKEAYDENIDGYINICPDIWFSEQALYYMIEASKQIPNKYFVITPQISKLWDSSWDSLVNPIYNDIPYENWNKQDMFNIINNQKNSTQEISLHPIYYSKYAGWIDLYSKSHYEVLAPIWDEWKGKGGWDLYSMIVSNIFKQNGGDFQQYVLEGKTIFRLSYCKNFKDSYLYSYYKEAIKLNPQSKQLNQITSFEEKIPYYVQEQIKKIKI
jgi:hypothetical protein